MVDDDGQICIGLHDHIGEHMGTGLRAWLERATVEAFDRTYSGPFAQGILEMERPLMARFGYTTAVIDDRDETRQVPNTAADYLAWGWPAPGRYERSRTILVRYARDVT